MVFVKNLIIVHGIAPSQKREKERNELIADGSLEEPLPHLKPTLDEINAYPASDLIELQLPVGWMKIRA